MSAGEPYDLIVVGAGVAGWSAARRAQQLGQRVLVLEKFESGPGFGNGRMSGGVFHAVYLDPLRPPADLRRVLDWATGGAARPDVADAFANTVGHAFRFLEGEGAQFAENGPFEWNRHTLKPFRPLHPDMTIEERWRGAGPDVLLTRLFGTFVEAGGDFRPSTRIVELVTDGDAVVGVRAPGGDVHGRAVLLADGGFHSNRQLGRTHYGSDAYLIRASHQNMGDGLRMALAVGAGTTTLDQFYGHLHHRDAIDDTRLWTRPSLDYLGEGGLVVTADGRRIAPNWPTFMHLAHDILRSETPLGSWVILDANGWRELGGEEGEFSPETLLGRLGAELVRSHDLAEVATRTGIPPERLQAAIDEHNAHLDDPIPLPESGEGLAHPPVRPTAIAQPPYTAVPLCVGITFGLGGVLVNGSAQVLDTGERPIAGLYAAGNIMGGLQGGPDHGYSGGWSQASTFGVIAAEHVAAQAGAAAEPAGAVG